MIAYRQELTGCLWIEVALMKVMNDSPTATLSRGSQQTQEPPLRTG